MEVMQESHTMIYLQNYEIDYSFLLNLNYNFTLIPPLARMITQGINYAGKSESILKRFSSTKFDVVGDILFLDNETFRIPGDEEVYFINKQKVAYEYLKRCDCYSFSAPTSLGKTFVIRTFIKDCIESGEKSNFVIVVPTNALINEVYNRIIERLKIY